MTWQRSVLLGIASAGESLTSHRLRSALTLLSVGVGVASVLAIAAYREYTGTQVTAILAQFGSNLVVISPAPPLTRGVRTGKVMTLTVDDASAIQQTVPHVQALSAVKSGTVNAIADPYSWSTQAAGVTADFPSIQGLAVQEGRFISSDDEAATAPVAVLGIHVVEHLFPGVDPVGRALRLNGTEVQVIGVLAPRGQSATGDLDDILYVPLSTAFRRLYGSTGLDRIEARVDSRDQIAACIHAMTTLLEQRHRTPPGAADDFEIQNYQAVADRAVAATDALAGGLAAGAVLALIIAGFGVMNIMLLSVSERTPEIGIRLAVGARDVDVRTQFLAEAVTLCLGGAMLGAAAALVAAAVVTWRIGIEVVPPAPAAVLATGISVGVGLIFGIYPAERAARLDPIVALRSE